MQRVCTEKRIQSFKMGGVLEAYTTIKTLLEPEENEEVPALYGGGRHVLPLEYKNQYASNGILGPWNAGSDT